jgi:hypothetical protein
MNSLKYSIIDLLKIYELSDIYGFNFLKKIARDILNIRQINVVKIGDSNDKKSRRSDDENPPHDYTELDIPTLFEIYRRASAFELEIVKSSALCEILNFALELDTVFEVIYYMVIADTDIRSEIEGECIATVNDCDKEELKVALSTVPDEYIEVITNFIE